MKTAEAAVDPIMRTASSAPNTSPLPMTGTETAAATSSIAVQSAFPV